MIKGETQIVADQGTSRYSSYLSNSSHHGANIIKFVTNISGMSRSTAYQYFRRLSDFESFVSFRYNIGVDEIITRIKEGSFSPYDVLSGYIMFMQDYRTISVSTLNQRVVTAKNFLEYCDVDISPRKFELKVKLPRMVKKAKEALSKEAITEILNACSDIRLKTFVMFLASTGCRSTEALSIRYADLDETSNPAKILIRGEYTKTKSDRVVFLTSEMTKQLKLWMDYKHRTRRVCYRKAQTGESTTEYRTPAQDSKALIFALYQRLENQNPANLYSDIDAAFARTLDRIGKGSFEDNNRRRKITLHSFRRFVKSTISDLGFGDYSEYFIGHSGSTYYRKTDKEKEELYKKIEPFLTFLDFPSLERRGVDIQSKMEALEKENQALLQNNTMVSDSVTILSDKVSKLMQEIEVLKKGR
jgi:integrase